MIALDLTPAAARAVDTARALAGQSGGAQAEPFHLLQGLLHEEEGLAMALLRRAGIMVDALRGLVDLPRDLTNSEADQPPFSKSTEEILSHAREVAVDISGERTIASDHLLLALLRCDEVVRQKLTDIGLSITHLEAEMATAQAPALQLEDPLRLGETSEQTDTARILDAGANRAREALRVLEDYCRFALADPFLTEELKRLRHDLTEALMQLPPGQLLSARDTLHDPGTVIATESEQQRYSLLAVAAANCKRLQEALRSLEEFGKLRGGELGRALESLRYRSYTLERAILLGTNARQRLVDARLYVLVTSAQCLSGIEWTIEEAAAGGAQIIQLREKGLSDRELVEKARRIRRLTQKLDVLFIMNDRPDIARLVEADGVHLGQDDLPVHEARRIVGADGIVGISTHDVEQVRQALLDGATYIGVGPIFPSATKHFSDFADLGFVSAAVKETSLPIFAIGGINLETLEHAVTAGARRVAVSDAICRADDPQQVAAQMRQILADVPHP